ncbi:MAG: MBL fold metallo-hydrolase [Deltaproteobacteria bacterium]|nr:MBL fold metallo-hydrolase [Candidatus Zymogenaceae bacterium]
MKLVILGSGTIVPSPARSSPSYLVETRDATILLDMGTDPLRRITEVGVGVRDIDAVLMSHFHPDHSAGLVPYLFASKYAMGSIREHDLTVIGGVGLNAFYENLKTAYDGWIVPEQYALELIEALPGEEYRIGDVTVGFSSVSHNPESLAFRLEADGASLVYSGDTDWSEDLISLASEADALILECSFPDDMKVPGHLTPLEAAELAERSGVGTLILTHFYPPVESVNLDAVVASRFSGSLIVARDLVTVEIGTDMVALVH